jgi:hypothetical protein
MKLTSTYNQIILEISHISHAARAWADFIYKEVKTIKDPELVIFGEEQPELYKNFPVDYFIITIDRNFTMGGYYDEGQSGLKNGKYCVYITVTPELSVSVLNHELRHAYEDYKRISKGKTALSKTKEVHNLFSGDFTDLLMGKIKGKFKYFIEVIWALYYTSKVEESAYGETVHDGSNKVIFGLEDILKKDYKVYWKKIYSDITIENSWDNLKTKVKIPILDKFNDYQSFLNWADKIIHRRGEIALKKFRKIKYLKGNEPKNLNK